MCRGFVCFHDNKWRAVPESSLTAEWKRGQKIESGGLQRIIAVERRWLLPASVDREQGGQLPISPCAQRSSPVVSCDYTVTSIRPQRRGWRVAGSGVCRGWRGFDLSLTKTLHIKWDESCGRIKGDYAWNQMFELMICLYRIKHGQEASHTAAKWILTAAFRSVTSSKQLLFISVERLKSPESLIIIISQ